MVFFTTVADQGFLAPFPYIAVGFQSKLYSIKVDGVETCFNEINRCNLYAQFDPVQGYHLAKDEDNRDNEYKKKGPVPKKATFRCQLLHHNEDSVKANLSRGVGYIRAVLQDNNTECWNGEDEIERPTEWVSYYYPGIHLPQVKKCKKHLIINNMKEFE